MADEIELTSERDMVKGTVPYQFRPTIRVNRETCVKAFGFYLRPRTVVLALAAAVAFVWWLLRLLGRAR
jgi:hypothetical protein